MIDTERAVSKGKVLSLC